MLSRSVELSRRVCPSRTFRKQSKARKLAHCPGSDRQALIAERFVAGASLKEVQSARASSTGLLSKGAIIGLVIGLVGGLLLAAAATTLCFWLCRKRLSQVSMNAVCAFSD